MASPSHATQYLLPIIAMGNFAAGLTSRVIDPVVPQISEQLAVDKVYLETHRDTVLVDDATLEKAKAFFAERGVETAGGQAVPFDPVGFGLVQSLSHPGGNVTGLTNFAEALASKQLWQ